jgi:formate hydrogenlyase subunit 3/multisubunit Na+/H+ antiporter MnhD subunit
VGAVMRIRVRWYLAAVIILGGLMAAGYVFKVLGYAFTPAPVLHAARAVPASMEWAALLLALGAILLGFMAPLVLSLVDIGGPLGHGAGA